MTSSDLVALVARLKARLKTIPKPGSKPFDPPPNFAYTTMMGGEHKPGDPAGYASVNVNLTGCSTASSVFKMQEMVYAAEPLSWEAAAAIEQLQAELLEYQQCLDAGIEHRMRRKAETEAESLRAELAACKRKIDELFPVIAHGDDKHRAWLKDAIEKHFDAARAQAGDSPPQDNWYEPADGRRLAEHNKDK